METILRPTARSTPGNNPVLPPSPPLIPTAKCQHHGGIKFSAAWFLHSSEQVPITGVISAVEAILRQPRRVLFSAERAQCRSRNDGPISHRRAVQCRLWNYCWNIFRRAAIVDGTREDSRRATHCGSDLSAEPLHFFVPRRFAGASRRSFRIGCRFDDSDDSFAGGFRSCGLGVFTIHQIRLSHGTMHLGFWLVATIFGVRFMNSGFKGILVPSRRAD